MPTANPNEAKGEKSTTANPNAGKEAPIEPHPNAKEVASQIEYQAEVAKKERAPK